MDEQRIRALIRKEIAAAFGSLADEVHESWRHTGADTSEETALAGVREAVRRAAEALRPTEPEDPFAVNPADKARNWAYKIRGVIQAAEEDGMRVWIGTDSQDISRDAVVVSDNRDSVVAWESAQ